MITDFKIKRLQKGMTQHQIARLLNVSEGRVSQWETQRKAPTAEQLKVLNKILNDKKKTSKKEA